MIPPYVSVDSGDDGLELPSPRDTMRIIWCELENGTVCLKEVPVWYVNKDDRQGVQANGRKWWAYEQLLY